jgi:hypothetical protein
MGPYFAGNGGEDTVAALMVIVAAVAAVVAVRGRERERGREGASEGAGQPPAGSRRRWGQWGLAGQTPVTTRRRGGHVAATRCAWRGGRCTGTGAGYVAALAGSAEKWGTGPPSGFPFF